jgi:polyisoprenoid-binding protein YceI
MTSPNVAPVVDLSALAGSWSLDPSQTSIVFHTKAMWMFKVKGTIKAIEGGGTVGADGSVSGSLVMDAASVDTNKKKRDDHLRAADFFEVDQFPTITFTISSAHTAGEGKVEVAGTLTIHGQTRPLTFLADVSVTDGSATVSAEVDIDRSAWGLSWAKMGAGLANRVLVSARFTKA